ncbi:type VI secretion protein (plasmid) [Robbsia andropogonis]|uniref:type VI secretion protein n=1 Tax=Robbsia andropogonis TaxID=28092 RepID=UPI003D20DE50
MKQGITRGIGLLLAWFLASSANATMIVFDPTNNIETTISALKAVQGEIYQNTNIVYQYQMLENQILQATHLSTAAMSQAYSQVTSDQTKATQYLSTLTSLYGDLTSGANWLSSVQAQIKSSGKTPTQWFADMKALRANKDQRATAMFQMGNDVITHLQTTTQRRQELQSQLSMSPTQQATAQLTTHYLDVISSQLSDLTQMMAVQQQKSAQQSSENVAKQQTNADTLQDVIAKQAAQRAALSSALPTDSSVSY